MAKAEQLAKELLLSILREAYFQAYQVIPQETGQLRSALTIEVLEIENGRLLISHYYAEYVHDDQSARRRNKPYIWFKNPGDDPRLRGGRTPERASQLRSLRPSEFHRARRLGQLVITRRRKAVKGSGFFLNEEGMAGFRQKAGMVASKRMSQIVRDELGDLFKMKESLKLSLGI